MSIYNNPEHFQNISEFNRNLAAARKPAQRGKLIIPGTSLKVDLKKLKGEELDNALRFLKVQAEALKTNNERILNTIKNDPDAKFKSSQLKIQENELNETLLNLEGLLKSRENKINKDRGLLSRIFNAIFGGRLFAASDRKTDELKKLHETIQNTLHEIIKINHSIAHIDKARQSLDDLEVVLSKEQEIMKQFEISKREMSFPVQNYTALHSHKPENFAQLVTDFNKSLEGLRTLFAETKEIMKETLKALQELEGKDPDVNTMKGINELRATLIKKFETKKIAIMRFQKKIQETLDQSYVLLKEVREIFGLYPKFFGEIPGKFPYEKTIFEGQLYAEWIDNQSDFYEANKDKKLTPQEKKILKKNAAQFLSLEDAKLSAFMKRLNDAELSGEKALKEQIAQFEKKSRSKRLVLQETKDPQWKEYVKRKDQLKELRELRQSFPHYFRQWENYKEIIGDIYEQLFPTTTPDIFDPQGEIHVKNLSQLKTVLNSYHEFALSRQALIDILESERETSEKGKRPSQSFGLMHVLAEINAAIQRIKTHKD